MCSKKNEYIKEGIAKLLLNLPRKWARKCKNWIFSIFRAFSLLSTEKFQKCTYFWAGPNLIFPLDLDVLAFFLKIMSQVSLTDLQLALELQTKGDMRL